MEQVCHPPLAVACAPACGRLTPSPATSRRYITANPRVRHSARYSTKRIDVRPNAPSSSVNAAMAAASQSEDLASPAPRARAFAATVRAPRPARAATSSASGVRKMLSCASSTLPTPSAVSASLHVDALRVRAHQHRDVGSAQRHVVEADRGSRAASRSSRAISAARGANCGGPRRRAASCRHRLPSGSIQTVQRSRAARRRVREQRAMARRRGHRADSRGSGSAKARAFAPNSAVLRGDQRRRRALVRRAACSAPARRARCEIRVQVGIAEAVDRLLRIAQRGTPARHCRGRSRSKIANCSGSVSWNSSISAAGYCARRRSGNPDGRRLCKRGVGGCAADRRSRRRVHLACAWRISARARRSTRRRISASRARTRLVCARRRSPRQRVRQRRRTDVSACGHPCSVHFRSRADVSRSSLSVLRILRQRIVVAQPDRPQSAKRLGDRVCVVDVADAAHLVGRLARRFRRSPHAARRHRSPRRSVERVGSTAMSAPSASRSAGKRSACRTGFASRRPTMRAKVSGESLRSIRYAASARCAGVRADVTTPEIVDDVPPDRAVVGTRARRRTSRDANGVSAERAARERVDREYGRLVEAVLRDARAARRCRRACVRYAPRRAPAARWTKPSPPAAVAGVRSVSTMRSRDPRAELGGGRVGERDDEVSGGRRSRAPAAAAGTGRRCSGLAGSGRALRPASYLRART